MLRIDDQAEIDTVAYLTEEFLGAELLEMFYTITGTLWNRTKGTPLSAVQKVADFSLEK